MTGPVPPRPGSVRAAILALLPVDGSPVSRRVLLRALPLHKHTPASSALREGAQRVPPMVVREDRPDGEVFYRRVPVCVGRRVRW